MIDSLKPRKVEYVQAWYPVWVEKEAKTYQTKSTQTDDFHTQMTAFLDDVDKDLEAFDVVDRMKMVDNDLNDIDTAFDMAVMEKFFSSEEERHDLKRRVIDKLMFAIIDHR